MWTPVFTRFMHDYVSAKKIVDTQHDRELFVGDVIHAAIQSNMHIESVLFQGEKCLDIGTPEDLLKATQSAHNVQEDFPGKV